MAQKEKRIREESRGHRMGSVGNLEVYMYVLTTIVV